MKFARHADTILSAQQIKKQQKQNPTKPPQH